jgi:hypothetical protein
MNVPPIQPFLGPLSEPRTNAILGAMLGEEFVVEKYGAPQTWGRSLKGEGSFDPPPPSIL